MSTFSWNCLGSQQEQKKKLLKLNLIAIQKLLLGTLDTFQ